MKIVVLDVDGVLNHCAVYSACAQRPGQTKPADWVDRQCVARIDALCQRTGAVLVISSAWPSYLGNDAFVAVMRECGMAAPIVGFCSSTVPEGTDPAQSFTRWDKIREWLTAHPEVTSWVLVDDCFWGGFPPEHFVHTDRTVGLTDADVECAAAILGES